MFKCEVTFDQVTKLLEFDAIMQLRHIEGYVDAAAQFDIRSLTELNHLCATLPFRRPSRTTR